MNLFAGFEAVAARQPDRLALQIKEDLGYRRLAYGEVAGQVRALAAALVRAGLRPGDRVALLSENRPEWIVAYLAATAAGGTAVPLDVQLSDGEIATVLEHAGCRMGIASGKHASRLLALLGGLYPSTAPAIVDIYLDRPAVIPEVATRSAALIGNFGAADEAVLDLIFGRFKPSGRLPFELPSSMEAVRRQKPDLPHDSENPLYPFGHGLSY